MAQQTPNETAKRKLEDDDLNWPASDLEHALEKRRKLEEAEPYNDEAVRQKAKEIGIEKAMSSSVSEVSKISQNVPPRGLSSEGDESSEFVSADDDDGVPIQAADGVGVAVEGELMNESVSEGEGGQGSGNEGVGLEGDDEEEEECSESQQEVDETQVVQDSIAAGAGTGPATALEADDRDSGHGSMDDSEVEVEEDEEGDDGMPESAHQTPPTNGSQDRMSAAEETVRQIKAERNADAAIEGSTVEAGAVEGMRPQQIAVPGLDAGEAREKYVADRKARKKERKALARSGQRMLIHQRRHTHLKRDIAPKKKKPVPPVVRMRDGKPNGPSKRKHTQAQKRMLKRVRHQTEIERAARENPGVFAQKLQAQIVDVSDISDFSDTDEEREHRLAAKKSRRAAFKLQKFQELVARLEAGEGGSDLEM